MDGIPFSLPFYPFIVPFQVSSAEKIPVPSRTLKISILYLLVLEYSPISNGTGRDNLVVNGMRFEQAVPS